MVPYPAFFVPRLEQQGLIQWTDLSQSFTIPAGGMLTGSTVLPGFSLTLAELFYQ
jgi:hypothetical protein